MKRVILIGVLTALIYALIVGIAKAGSFDAVDLIRKAYAIKKGF